MLYQSNSICKRVASRHARIQVLIREILTPGGSATNNAIFTSLFFSICLSLFPAKRVTYD